MGFSVTIAAVSLLKKDAFLDAASLQVTDKTDPEGEALLSATIFGDHFLMWRNLRAAPMFSEPDWAALSQAAPVSVLDVVDTAGAQVLRGFENGAQRWEVSFQDSNENLLAIVGTPPFNVAAKREALRVEHLKRYPEDMDEDDDSLVAGYGMEIPSRLFEDMTGIYYEDGPPDGLHVLSDDLPQVKLSWSGKPQDKPWWKFW